MLDQVPGIGNEAKHIGGQDHRCRSARTTAGSDPLLDDVDRQVPMLHTADGLNPNGWPGSTAEDLDPTLQYRGATP